MFYRTSQIIFFLILAFSSQLFAQTTDDFVADGREAFGNGNFEEAVRSFEFAYALDPHPIILTNLARCYEEQGDLLTALRYYRQVLSMNELSIMTVVQSRIDNVETRLQNMGYDPDVRADEYIPRGTFFVRSTPEGADVYLNEVYLGQTPFESDWINEGEYRLGMQLDGYHTVRDEIMIIGLESSRFSYRLRDQQSLDSYVPPDPGTLTIVGSTGEEVLLDGEPWNETPIDQILLSPGQYEVEILRENTDELEEVLNYSATIMITSGDETVITLPQTDTNSDISEFSPYFITGGSVFAATGGILALIAFNAANKYQNQPNSLDRADRRQSARQNAFIADALITVGAAAIIAGIFFHEKPEEEEENELLELLTFGPGPRLLGISLHGRF